MISAAKTPNRAFDTTLKRSKSGIIYPHDGDSKIPMNRAIASLLFVASLSALYVSCEKPPAVTDPEDMSPVSVVPEIDDDLFPAGLKESINSTVAKLSQRKNYSLAFGNTVVSGQDYALSLVYLLEKLEDGISKEAFIDEVRKNFDFYGFPGKTRGGVFITSYFSPVLSASDVRTSRHSQALYASPDDLVRVRMDKYIREFERFSFLEDDRVAKSKFKSLFGRVISVGHGKARELVPYYSRKDIDSSEKLAGKNLEIAWLDAVDAFFLQIQGSGKLRFSDGREMVVGYSSQNGHGYVAIGKFLLNHIPREKMSLWAIENHLRSLSYKEMRKILYKNPSYIFFRELSGNPETAFGTEVVDGRTIATDEVFFPKGALGFMRFESPVFETPVSVEPSDWKPVSRFVSNHDSGGAIKGARRVDLFWGEGKDASRHAGVMKNWGELFCLVPKPGFVAELKRKLSDAGDLTRRFASAND